jgi:mxaJ protein
MYRHFYTRSIEYLIAVMLTLLCVSAHASTRELRVCADPNNLPFSNQRLQGFENQIVALLARDMGATVRYTWWAQRRGFVRNTLNAGVCDVIPGTARDVEMLATTTPYYRSSYVFVTRSDRKLDIADFDDPRLPALRIGVQMIGDDFSNTPPAHALARRGIVDNVRGYMVYGDYARDDPSRAIVDAVVTGDIDVAVVWGPLAGYLVKQKHETRLQVVPISSPIDANILPMTFAVSMGVRKGDQPLRAELNAALERNRPQIEQILTRFGVPQLTAEAEAQR